MITRQWVSLPVGGEMTVRKGPERHPDGDAGEGFGGMAEQMAALLPSEPTPLPMAAEEQTAELPVVPEPVVQAEGMHPVSPAAPAWPEPLPVAGTPVAAPAEAGGARPAPGETASPMTLGLRHFADSGAVPAARHQSAPPAQSDASAGRRTSALALQGELALKASALPPVVPQVSQEGERAASPMTSPPPFSAAERPSSAVHEWAAIKVEQSAAGNKAALGQQLLHSLKEKVEMQLNQQVQQARIKLDPPEMGRLELTVRVEGDRLHIQLNASQGAVREALASQLDRLRAELLPHHAGGVEVNVGQGDRQGREDSDDMAIANAVAEEENNTGSGARSRDWINALV
ncbi:flagellar hook-length control protein FliK [Zobellella iuensis]|uniref:Flagellar hook-length control protein FliK n=1 Tax=Zobellella iuensis TaxID=2803811 RepID=A0ABS1QWA8_9GAMM|nr:flagellar hook-length control protein FliK [Zobellella iuensis]MBL1378842.1 flagellar hook-length control protein FliK [Zobellella iuensis]